MHQPNPKSNYRIQDDIGKRVLNFGMALFLLSVNMQDAGISA